MRRFICSIAVVIAACLPVSADIVTFVDDIELAGPNVEVMGEEGESLLLRVKYGKVRVLKSRVRKVEIDFEQRCAKVEERGGTAMAWLQLGRICEETGMLDEAAEAYRAAVEKPTVLPEDLKAMGEFFEKQDLPGDARKAYEKFLEVGGEDKQVASRLADLPKGPAEPEEPDEPEEPEEPEPDQPEEPEEPEEPKEPEPDKPDEPEPAPAVEEGFEGTVNWKTQSWANPGETSVQILKDDGVENRILSVTFGQGKHDKTAVGCYVNNLDLTEFRALVFDAYNDSKRPLKLAFAVITMPTQYIESQQISIAPNEWQRHITFDLTTENYKSEATNWVNRGSIENRDKTQQLFFMIYNTAREGSVHLDDITFKTEEELQELE